MQVLDSPNIRCFSPKRKRDVQDSSMIDAPSPSRLKTANLPVRPLLETEVPGEGSPWTTVAGHLQDLDLDPQHEIQRLDSNKSIEAQTGSLKAGFGSGALNSHLFHSSQPYSSPISPPSSSDDPNSASCQTNLQDQPLTFTLEIPETPRLRPVSSTTPPPSINKAKPPKSLPPTPSIQALWWSDTEITGHDPKDPTDDGYGINGIGFLPTPAVAKARVERRKKQIAEWKLREAREARQKRSDRRRKKDAEAGQAGRSFCHDDGSTADRERKVRFLEV